MPSWPAATSRRPGSRAGSTCGSGRPPTRWPTLSGGYDLVFIDADKPSNPIYLREALRLGHPGTVIIADNVVREGEVTDPHDSDPRVRGVRRFFEMAAADPRIEATALQTVGSKGWDGFALLRVGGPGQPLHDVEGVHGGRRDRVEDVLDHAVPEDQREPPVEDHVAGAEGGHAECRGQRHPGVGQQRVRQAQPMHELPLIAGGLRGQAEHPGRPGRQQLRVVIAEPGRLLGRPAGARDVERAVRQVDARAARSADRRRRRCGPARARRDRSAARRWRRTPGSAPAGRPVPAGRCCGGRAPRAAGRPPRPGVRAGCRAAR